MRIVRVSRAKPPEPCFSQPQNNLVPLFLGEGSPSKKDYREIIGHPYSNLSNLEEPKGLTSRLDGPQTSPQTSCHQNGNRTQKKVSSPEREGHIYSGPSHARRFGIRRIGPSGLRLRLAPVLAGLAKTVAKIRPSQPEVGIGISMLAYGHFDTCFT